MNLVLAALAFQSNLQTQTHTFELTLPRAVKSVHVAGTFNNWNGRALPMTSDAGGKHWKVTTSIPVGRHMYKFVINDTAWVVDPNAASQVPDGLGNTNSLLLVLPSGFESAAATGDGRITESAIAHSSKIPDINFDQGMLQFRLQTRTGDIQECWLHIQKSGAKPTKIAMTLAAQDELYATYTAECSYTKASSLKYWFSVKDGNKKRELGRNGLRSAGVDCFEIKASESPLFAVPQWVEGTVFYQIFPDRFENGDKSNDPEGTIAWDGDPAHYNWFGGDAAGVVKRMGHLKSLGVNGVYINPVMTANSNHRYDPCDYFKVDPSFASNDEFVDMVAKLDRSGIRVVLDQIYDHCGTKFAPFVDVLKNQEKSKFKDYFFIKSYPVEVRQKPPYEGWFGTEWMPKLNLKQPDLKKYLLDSTTFWMKQARLSGWRLDVADEVPEWFWREFRQHVKAINPKAWIVGEVWGDARRWLSGDQWDASMNYPFRAHCLAFIAKGTAKPSHFLNGLMQVWNLYVPQVSRNQLNMLSSHDTARFLTEAGGDRRLQKLAVAVQMTWPGAPSIYYGEELGMEGKHDPDNRRGMRWDLADESNDMLAWYKKLIQLRRNSPIIMKGKPRPVMAFDNEGVAVYAVDYQGQTVMTLINRSEKTHRLNFSTGSNCAAWRDMLSGELTSQSGGTVDLSIPPMSARILRSSAGRTSGAAAGSNHYAFRKRNHSQENQL